MSCESELAVELYSTSCRALSGTFSAWGTKRENLRLLSTPPAVRGRKCRVGSPLELTQEAKGNLQSIVNRELAQRRDVERDSGDDGRPAAQPADRGLVYNADGIDWRLIMLGQ